MATLTWTIPAGHQAGATMRNFAKKLERMAAIVPDNVATGASTVVTFDNGATGGADTSLSVTITSGPHTDGKVHKA